MEYKNQEISLFTEGAIKTLTDNHFTEVEAVKHKYENKIKQLTDQHEKNIIDINKKHLISLQNTRDTLEHISKNEIINIQKCLADNNHLLQESNRKLAESLIISNRQLKYLDIKYKTEIKYRERANNFIYSLRKELGRSIDTGKKAWETFEKYSPNEYYKYISSQYQTDHYKHESSSIWSYQNTLHLTD
jgi:hypothetical protein